MHYKKKNNKKKTLDFSAETLNRREHDKKDFLEKTFIVYFFLFWKQKQKKSRPYESIDVYKAYDDWHVLATQNVRD